MFVFIFYDYHKSLIARLQLAYEKKFQDKLQEKKDYLFEIYKQKLYHKLHK
jgi:hypothetical protein